MDKDFVAALMAGEAITPGFRISYLANFYAEPVYKEVQKRHGIARGEFVVLMCLRGGGTLTAQDICRLTGRPKNSISQAVAKLEAAGFLRRTADADDARRNLLDITRAGENLCGQILPLFFERERQMLAVLSEVQREQLGQLLKVLTIRDDDWARPY